jgi:hypothetical protein
LSTWFQFFYFCRYACHFVEKINSKCHLFEHDTENFKGPDGTLLCYKTDVFKELKRDKRQLPDDGRQEKHVSYSTYDFIAHFYTKLPSRDAHRSERYRHALKLHTR